MPRAPVSPVFVDRKTAAEMLMISIDTFDTWLRAGFILPQQRCKVDGYRDPRSESVIAQWNATPSTVKELPHG